MNGQYDPSRLDRIEAGLERLTERQQALAESVEILTRDVQDMSKEMRSRFAETLGFINPLAHVAETHERRLDDLESGQQ